MRIGVAAVCVLCALSYVAWQVGIRPAGGRNAKLAARLAQLQQKAPRQEKANAPGWAVPAAAATAAVPPQRAPAASPAAKPSGGPVKFALAPDTPIKLVFPPGKPRAIIHMLIQDPNLISSYSQDGDLERAYARFELLRRMLHMFDHAFNDRHHYPLVLFHDKGLTLETHTIITQWTRSPLVWVPIEFTNPPKLTDSSMNTFVKGCHRSVGYKHMCRFHAAKMYENPVFDNVDYAWRLDDDSCILGPVKEDPFVVMRDGNFTYGFNKLSWDNAQCTRNLWPTIKAFKFKAKVKAKWLGKHIAEIGDFTERVPNGQGQTPGIKVFYNNFEISKVSFWKSAEYQSFFKYMDETTGIYTLRWGDAPIKTFAIQLFVPPEQIHCFKPAIQYAHQADMCEKEKLMTPERIKFVNDSLAL